MPDLFSITVPDEGLSLDDLEREFIYYMLVVCEGNKSQTCGALRLTQPRLRRIALAILRWAIGLQDRFLIYDRWEE